MCPPCVKEAGFWFSFQNIGKAHVFQDASCVLLEMWSGSEWQDYPRDCLPVVSRVVTKGFTCVVCESLLWGLRRLWVSIGRGGVLWCPQCPGILHTHRDEWAGLPSAQTLYLAACELVPQEAGIPGAVEAAGSWGHGLSLNRTPEREKQTQEEDCLSLWQEESRLIIPYLSHFSAQRTNQVLLWAAAHPAAVYEGEKEWCSFRPRGHSWLREVCPGENPSSHHGPGMQLLSPWILSS